jgi:ArsR family transcriptional regulator, arsenate/arsenite/antimonite-responsive transcriptional repressor
MSIGLTDIYKSFSDPTRLRILNLLLQQPLCVCHIQEVLGLPQVNTSQHLAYLRKVGLVKFHRIQTWKVYRLSAPASRELQLNLGCLAECLKTDPVFDADLSRLRKALAKSRSPTCADANRLAARRKAGWSELLVKPQ